MQKKKELTAPCGLACFLCDVYEDNLTEAYAQAIHDKFGVPKKDIPCRGCRRQDGKHFHLPNGCATLDCVKAREVNFCCDCKDFPCAFLAPTADRATVLPHNIKLYNLCRIRKIGLERWINEEAGQIRTKYFNAPFVMGKGQAD